MHQKLASAPDGPCIDRRRLLLASLAAASLPLALVRPLLADVPGAMTADDALAMATARRAELVDLLSRLIRIRSLSGESGDVAQGIVMDYLSALPYRIEASQDRPSHYLDHAEYMPPNPPGDGPFVNVVARPAARASGHALFAHIDSHRVEDGWVSDPYEPVIRGSRLYGLGAGDDKGGVAAMLVATAALADAQGPAPLVICSHGKGGGSRGSLPVFQRLRAAGERVDAMLYIHPAETGRGLADIKHAVRGVLDLRLQVDGWEGDPLEIGLPDSALWRDGGDALAALSALIDELRDGVLADVDVNVGRLEAGQRPGGVPASAQADIRLLFDGEHSWRALMDAVNGVITAFNSAQGRAVRRYRAVATPLGMRSNPGAVPWDAPKTRALRGAIEAVKGQAPSAYPNHYGGDIRYPLRLLGAPAFGIGSLAGNFYGPNEWVDIDDLVRLVAVVILTLSRWNAGN